jgi:hypothetical protein
MGVKRQIEKVDHLYSFKDVHVNQDGTREVLAQYTPIGRDESGNILYNVERFIEPSQDGKQPQSDHR